MKKIIILVPVYNDWESLVILLNDINNVIQDLKNYQISCIIINDASNDVRPSIKKPSNLNSIKIINMKKNTGHQRCIAFGLRYINENNLCDYMILMDGDGEDRPAEIKNLINKIEENPEIPVVAKRVKRSEGIMFKFFYQIHKLITMIFTGKKINFGNYSCLTKENIKILSNKASLWCSYSSSIKKNLSNYNEIESVRGLRYYGPSKMSLFNLVLHSFSIISIFKYTVFLRSSFIIIILSFLNKFFGVYTIIIQIMLVVFSLLIFIISLRENEKAFLNSNKNVLDEVDITH